MLPSMLAAARRVEIGYIARRSKATARPTTRLNAVLLTAAPFLMNRTPGLQVQFYTEKVRDEMISKDTINEITKNKKEAIEQKKKIVRYKEEEILYMKTEIINDQDKLIELLTLQLLSSNGLMNCRGLLEELLREIHEEKKVEGNFNATNICNKIGTEDHDKQGKFEMILIEAAEKVVNKYKGSDLHRSGGGEPNEMYHYIYHQLSTGILEDPHYGMEVAIPTNFPEDWKELFTILAEGFGVSTTTGPEAICRCLLTKGGLWSEYHYCS